MSFPECGLCDGMRICNCRSEPIDKRFIAACHAMQGLLADSNCIGDEKSFANLSIRYADALIAELEKK